ncbi:PP2C family protein-serine/threonine phosphatase [Desulfatirhabdium butyrativorans]|uniref:PP2C family protein-serine/threonine phosphatase n=1 Tax=Desulfatirhabdium butyrativorans TaxID=340467 RepID=UPI00146FC043|nr:PP2C family serine/threonine-protein phosphatase [Desulfatirhabdium butyrativorans]
MHIIPGNCRHQGSRKEQQDDFGFSDMENPDFVRHGGVLAVVADGMGGLSLGKEAGYIGKTTMILSYQEKSVDESISRALRRSLLSANEAVVSLARKAGKKNQVGATLAAAVIHQNRLYWISVGDSRIYLCRNRVLIKLTQDHLYGRLLDVRAASGEIAIKEALFHPYRDALTSGLGWENLKEVNQNNTPLSLKNGDRILLCSDGVYKTLVENEIVQMLSGHPQQAAEALIKTALSKQLQNQDNMTAVIFGFERDV